MWKKEIEKVCERDRKRVSVSVRKKEIEKVCVER